MGVGAVAGDGFNESEYRDREVLMYAIRCLVHLGEELARQAGITRQQQALLLIVRGHAHYPTVTVGDVADRLLTQPHSASKLVERGVQQGLLDRQEDPADRRRVLLSLTSKGQQLLDDSLLAGRHEWTQYVETLLHDTVWQSMNERSR